MNALVMRSCLAVLALSALTVIGPVSFAADEAAPPKADPPRIEVVFVLDTTGSMGGLISAAKEKIWAIANTLATAKPAPDIQMGLVGYRDRGDEYVTKITELSADLDAVYTTLMAFQAGGGGDGPESVNQALHDAVNTISWGADANAYRVIYLVGDYPPHMDYQDDVKYPVSCKLAAEKGIIINTIQCGTHMPTEPIWNEIARLAEGQYFRVDQAGGAINAATPFDDKLAKQARDLDGTRIYYGTTEDHAKQAKREETALALYEKASLNAQAQRALYNASDAGLRNFIGEKELVTDVTAGLKLAEIDVKLLPEHMQKMSVKEREEYVASMHAKRQAIQQEITRLTAERQKYQQEEMRKAGVQVINSLDLAIFNSIRSQATRKGIQYDEKAMNM